jgi:hypothetical protein
LPWCCAAVQRSEPVLFFGLRHLGCAIHTTWLHEQSCAVSKFCSCASWQVVCADCCLIALMLLIILR